MQKALRAAALGCPRKHWGPTTSHGQPVVTTGITPRRPPALEQTGGLGRGLLGMEVAFVSLGELQRWGRPRAAPAGSAAPGRAPGAARLPAPVSQEGTSWRGSFVTERCSRSSRV